MKKVIKTIGIFIFCLLVFSITKQVKANSINNISMDIFIKQNGDAQINEIWECKSTEGTEIYHPYYNIGNSEIKDLKVSENGNQYQVLNRWNTSGNLSSKANKCGINRVPDGVELCWGISNYGTHTYQIRYTITKFVSQLNDSQMVYWTLIPYKFSNSIGNVEIKIHSDEYFPNTIDVWGYGNYGGLCYVDNGSIYMSSNGKLTTSEYMTILAKFPSGTFNAVNQINNDFNYYYDMAEKGSTKYNNEKFSDELTEIFGGVLSFIFMFIPFFVIFTIVVMLVTIYIQNIKLNLKVSLDDKYSMRNAEYFRDIPCKKDIFRAYYIAYEYDLLEKNTDLLGAIILKWIKEKKVRVEQKTTGKVFKKEDTIIILNETDTSTLKDSYEIHLFNMLYEASKDGILEDKEFEKWCKESYSKILGWFDRIIKQEKEELIKEGLITEEKRKIFKIFTVKEKIPQPQLKEEALQLAGLKRYLKEYTLIKEREAIEVTLFEEYLIYAQIMGIAKEVAKEFKELYPDIIEQSTYNSFDNIMFITICANRGIVRAESAKEAVARSYSSGGRGFSSGGGGRGSFGGGRCRRRFPLIVIIKSQHPYC